MSVDEQIKYSKKFTLIDLFAGCGGLSAGLEKAGFLPIFVNELNDNALESYLVNREDLTHLRSEKFYCNDVKELVKDHQGGKQFFSRLEEYFGLSFEKGDLDLLSGGPPCQGFSGIGHRRSYAVDKQKLPSNHLFQDMAYLVHALQPKIFLFENVKGLLSSKWTTDGEKGEIWEKVLSTFKSIPNYDVNFKLVTSSHYGVPQNRPRVLLVGIRDDISKLCSSHFNPVLTANGYLPEPTGGAPDLVDLLGDLLDPEYVNGTETTNYLSDPQNDIQKSFREDRGKGTLLKGAPLCEQKYSNHAPSVVARFKAMQKNNGIIPESLRTKKFSQRLLPSTWGNRGPSITATSLPDDYVHFSQPRTLTVREWARLQGFSDHYQFSGPRTTGGLRRAGNPQEGLFKRELPKYTQIGNAVPVQLAEAVGEHFAKLLTTASKEN